LTGNIVDIHGLAEILLCSDSMIEKTWAEYPHFFIGLGRTARGARFDIDDVVNYLKGRDYAEFRQADKKMDGESPAVWISPERKKRVPNKVGSIKMGSNNKKRTQEPESRSGLLVFPGS